MAVSPFGFEPPATTADSSASQAMALSALILAWAINTSRLLLAATFIVLFVASFSVGLGPIPFVLMGEAPPAKVRGNVSFGRLRHSLISIPGAGTFGDRERRHGMQLECQLCHCEISCFCFIVRGEDR